MRGLEGSRRKGGGQAGVWARWGRKLVCREYGGVRAKYIGGYKGGSKGGVGLGIGCEGEVIGERGAWCVVQGMAQVTLGGSLVMWV